MSWIKNRPLKVVICTQLTITVVVAIVIGFWLGIHGVVSVILGGMVSSVSSAAFAIIISRHKGYSASDIVRTALRAEAVKIIIIIILLWAVLKNYENINVYAFIGVFVVTILAHSVALLVADNINNKIN
ncbi:MAG: ATP synthase subunit I [Nitrosomonas sp.]|nr:ATP synthase subunit I [Nitrosomonas sp.]MBP7113613.1 ATP synthase subunit I [Nitrosomonas sp.]